MGRSRIAAFYFLFFCAVGIGLPYVPQALKAQGLSPWQVGLALATSPLCALLFPPLWGQLADRTGKPGLVLAVLATGTTLGTVGVYFSHGFAAVAACAFAGAVFGSAISTLADTVAMRAAVRAGTSFSRVRVFGSLGFIAASVAFGLAAAQIDRVAIGVMACLQGVAAGYAWLALRGERSEVHRPEGTRASGVRALLATPGVRGLLAACALHWVACAPYHGVFGVHLTARGLPPWVVGASTSMGVFAEVLVMLTWPRWAGRVKLPSLLAACFLASAARWVLTAHAGAGGQVALGLLHGLTFGAFYVAAVGWMAQVAPPSLRASAQSLFVSATFGFGGVVGYLLSGWLWDAVGTSRLFELAAAFELLPLALVLWRMKPEPLRPSAA